MMRKIFVGLDLTEMDPMLIDYAAFLGYAFPTIEEVIFFHNIQFEYPEEAAALVDELERPLADLLRDELNERIRSHFETDRASLSTRLLISEEPSTAREMAHVANEEAVELILLGKKDTFAGSGILVERLLNIQPLKAPVLLVPEYAFHRISKILTAVDFSKNAKSALLTAQRWERLLPAELGCLYVYKVPVHFFPHFPGDDLNEAMERDARKSFRQFVREMQSPPSCDFLPAAGRNIAQVLRDYAVRHNHDLIVVGTRGKNALTTFFVGSITLRLLKLKMHIPILIVHHV